MGPEITLLLELYTEICKMFQKLLGEFLPGCALLPYTLKNKLIHLFDNLEKSEDRYKM